MIKEKYGPAAYQSYGKALGSTNIDRQQNRQNPTGAKVDTSYDLLFKSFRDSQCIFVHIPKCAGISVARSLFGNDAGGHLPIRAYLKNFSEQEFVNFFKFTIVRNPWDRLVSAYWYLKNGGMNQSDRMWAEQHLSFYKNFNEFVIEWVCTENIETGLHFQPQYQFVALPKPLPSRGVIIPFDFIGSFENLHHDFSYIQQQLGFEGQLRHENKTPKKYKDFRSYYSDKTREIVANVYREDIALFGYDFDNSPRRYGGVGITRNLIPNPSCG